MYNNPNTVDTGAGRFRGSMNYFLLSPIVLMLFAILETFILLSISLFLCMYII